MYFGLVIKHSGAKKLFWPSSVKQWWLIEKKGVPNDKAKSFVDV